MTEGIIKPVTYLFLPGRTGGQVANGGKAASENLTLVSTVHATKGKILFGAAGNSAYDEVNNRLGIGTNAPAQKLHIYDSSVNSTPRWRLQNDARVYDFAIDGGFSDAFKITDETAAAPRLYIRNNGNVCIGNFSAPTELLYIHLGHVKVGDGYSFGLGAAAGRLVFNDLATDTAIFSNCQVGIGVAPATGVGLHVANDIRTNDEFLLTNFRALRSVLSTTYIGVSGGTSIDAGGNILFYGQSHATLPNLIALRQGTTIQLKIETGTGNIIISQNCVIQSGNELRFYDVGNSNYVGFEAPTLTANKTWVLPNADGAAGELLGTDGAGNLGWKITGPFYGFSVYRSTNQLNVVNETWTKILFDTEVFDPQDDYDNSVNYRYTPSVAGKYLINASLEMNDIDVDTKIRIAIYKNGTSAREGVSTLSRVTDAHMWTNVVSIEEANGSTDYFEVFVWHDNGDNTPDIQSDKKSTRFEAHLIDKT